MSWVSVVLAMFVGGLGIGVVAALVSAALSS